LFIYLILLNETFNFFKLIILKTIGGIYVNKFLSNLKCNQLFN